MKRELPAHMFIGNIYDVYRDPEKTIRLRRVQIVEYKYPNISLVLVEKFEHEGKSCFYPKVNVDATRQPEWKLVQTGAPLLTPNPPVEKISERAPKLPSGQIIDDVRVNDVYETRGTNTKLSDVTGQVQVMSVTPTMIYLQTLGEKPKGIRIWPSVGRGSFRDGRYKRISRDPDAPYVSRKASTTPELFPVSETTNPTPKIEEPPKQIIDPIRKCRVPLELITLIERDRNNGTLRDTYSHMTYRGNVIVANKVKVEETGNTVFDFEWNPND